MDLRKIFVVFSIDPSIQLNLDVMTFMLDCFAFRLLSWRGQAMENLWRFYHKKDPDDVSYNLCLNGQHCSYNLGISLKPCQRLLTWRKFNYLIVRHR